MADVLVPLDGSALAEEAIPLAVRLAAATGSGVHLFQAVPPPGLGFDAPIPIEPLIEAAQSYLSDVANSIRERFGVEPTIQAAFGFPTDTILHATEGPEIGFLAMSTHGRSGLGRAILGSVAEQVLRQSPVPVVLLPSGAEGAVPEAFRRILVPLDGSDLAYSVMGPIADLARLTGAELFLLRIGRGPTELVSDEGTVVVTADEEARIATAEAEAYLTPVAEHLRQVGLSAQAIVQLGDPVEDIVRIADEQQVDLIAIATHGRSGLDRLRHGSVAEAVLRLSHRPVLTFGREAIRRLWSGVSALSG